jgi:hypothetical protein
MNEEYKSYADKLFAESKLVARDEAEKAKRTALAILGSVALVLGLATTLGLKSHFETRIEAAAAKAATTAAKKAEELSVKALTEAIQARHRQSTIDASAVKANYDESKAVLEQLRGLAGATTKQEPDRGFIALGDTLICYGAHKLAGTTHTRTFAFTFADSFTSPPFIIATPNIDEKGSGDSFAIYRSKITTTEYTGSLITVLNRPAGSDVTMHYIAIGRRALESSTLPSSSPAQ